MPEDDTPRPVERIASAAPVAPNRRLAYALPVRMTEALYISLALAVGVGSALQVGMLASLGRMRGPTEAAWVSMLASIIGLTLVLGIRALAGNRPELPSPFDNLAVFAAVTLAACWALTVSLRGLNPYFGFAGIPGVIYVVAAGFLAPRVGIALYATAVTAGTLAGAVLLDHIGAFGNEMQRLSLTRLLGIAALLLGVLLVRRD